MAGDPRWTGLRRGPGGGETSTRPDASTPPRAPLSPHPHIYVDADACPVKDEVYRVADRYSLPVTLVAASWLRVPDGGRVSMVVVKDGGQLDAADDWIVEHVSGGDVVVTEDILLAARCLEKEARVLTPRGRVHTRESIGEAVAMRELMADLREAGAVSGGAAPFERRDRSAFLQRLDEAVQASRRER